MKRSLIIFSIAFFCHLYMHIYAQSEEIIERSSILCLAESTVDVGEVSGDSVVIGNLILYNKGSVTVEILKIFTDCRCTVASYTDRPIAPGDSSIVTVKFDPKGYKYYRFRNRFRIRSTASNSYLSAFLTGTIKK